MFNRRGLGYVPDPPDSRDLELDVLGLAGSGLPVAHSLLSHCGPVLDQGGTNSCVAQSIAQAIRTEQRADGDDDAQLISRLALYFDARAQHGAELRDAGTYIRAAFKALARLGAPPEAAWPWNVRRINRSPSFSARWAAHDFRGVRGYYRIYDRGADRLHAIRSAIASNRPVVAGWAIDADFTRDAGPHVIGAQGKTVGRHAMALVGYDGDQFELVNSWGTGWRNGGFARVTSEFVLASEDVWVVDTEN